MSGIMIRLPVSVTVAIFVVAAGPVAVEHVDARIVLTGGAASRSLEASPPRRWPAPLDMAPAKIDKSVSTLTYECGNQSPIIVVSIDSNVTLNGSCGEVDVSGSANTVNLQTVAIIKATGSGNHITWQQGPGGGVPQISNPGGSNSIVGPAGIQAPSGRS